MGHRLGLRLQPQDIRRSLPLCGLLACGVALACAGLDWTFRPVLTHVYIEIMTRTSWWVRVVVYIAHALNEEILYRLFLGSALTWLFRSLAPAGVREKESLLWCAFALSQVVNVGVNVWLVSPPSPPLLLYQLLRFFAPGMVWAWLYVRRGFTVAVSGHLFTQVIFQPLTGVLLGL